MDNLIPPHSSRPAPSKTGLAVFLPSTIPTAASEKDKHGPVAAFTKVWTIRDLLDAMVQRFPPRTFSPAALEDFHKIYLNFAERKPSQVPGEPPVQVERALRLGLEFLKAGIVLEPARSAELVDPSLPWSETRADLYGLYNRSPGDWYIQYRQAGSKGGTMVFKARRKTPQECVLDIPSEQGWWSFFWSEPLRGTLGLSSPVEWTALMEEKLGDYLVALGFSGTFRTRLSVLCDGFSQALNESILKSVDITV